MRHIVISIIALVLTWLLCQTLILTASVFNPLDRALSNLHMTDLFYEIEGQDAIQDTSGTITIVDMTDVFSRTRLAEIVGTIDSLQPAIVGVDIVFDGLRDDSLGNESLVETAYSTSSPILWAYKLTDWSEEEGQFTKAFHSFFIDPEVKLEEGYTNVQRDVNGGTVNSFGIRRQVEEHTEYSLPARIAVGFTGDSTFIKKHQDCSIHYSHTYFPIVHCDSIVQHADQIKGHIVLLGAINDKRDMHYTPLGLIAGVHILALTIKTIIDDSFPYEWPFWLTILSSFILIYVCEILYSFLTERMTKQHHCWLVRKIGKHEIAEGFVSFGFIFLIVYLDYMLFVKEQCFLNVTWVIMSITLLDMSRKIYKLLQDIKAALIVKLRKRKNKKKSKK